MTSRLAELGLLYCAAVWGSTFYIVKDALAGVDPVALVAYRFLLSAALLAPCAAWRARRSGWGGGLLRDSGTLSALLLILYVTQTAGLAWTSASNSGFITGLFVLFVPLFLFLGRGQAFSGGQRAAVGLALAGLWLLTGGPSEFNRGDALTLFSAVTYAGHLLVTDRCVKEGADTVPLAFHQFWMTGLGALILAAGMGYPLGVRDGKTAAVIAFLALLPTVSAFFVQMIAQRHAEPLKVSLIFSLEPVFAALFAVALGGETLSAAGLTGGALIVAAMFLSELFPARPSAEPSAA